MTNPVYLTPAWKACSKRTIERAGGRCEIQLPGCKGRATTADHIVELADGGEVYDMANLQAACRSCNTAKRNRRVAQRARRQVRAW